MTPYFMIATNGDVFGVDGNSRIHRILSPSYSRHFDKFFVYTHKDGNIHSDHFLIQSDKPISFEEICKLEPRVRDMRWIKDVFHVGFGRVKVQGKLP